ncbi:MAG: right-handed parallel beta-helix repeat-containing protein [Moheibacter sp.]
MRFFPFLFLILSTFSSAQQNFYVSPNGLDSNDGLNSNSSFKTIEKAKQAVRTFRQKNPQFGKDVIVNLSSGNYILSKTLEFNKRDGGNEKSRTVFKKNNLSKGKVFISGERVISGWELHDAEKNIWKAEIGDLFARQIFIRDKQSGQVKKSIRARSDDTPFKMREYGKGYKVQTKNIDFRNWNNIRDMEVVSNLYWVSTRVPVLTNDKKKKLVIEPEFWNHIHIQWNVYQAPFNWLENALELVDSPNEWYIDRLSNPGKNTVYYHFGNSNPADSDIIVPALEKLISAKDADYISFENIQFLFTTWNGPSTYLPEKKSNNGFRAGLGDRYTEYAYTTHHYKNMAQIPGALSFDSCSEIIIKDCGIAHIGSTAIEFFNGSNNNLIEKCTIEDIAASGISLHGWKGSDLTFQKGIQYIKDHPEQKLLGKGNKILQNRITNIANDYLSSCGIVIGYAQNTTISRNDISDFPYSGIAFIAYNYDTIAEDGTVLKPGNVLFLGTNEVSNNQINCSEQVMPDGGGIYTFGYHGDDFDVPEEKRSKFFGNKILNQKFYQGAIYLDKYSSNIDVYDNIVDIENNRRIEQKYGLPVYSIAYRYGSSNIDIYNNYCNDRYLSVPNTCIDGTLCYNILLDNITYFRGFEGYKD